MATNRRFYFKWGVILVLAILIFMFFAFYAKQFGEAALELDIKGNKISVKTSQLKLLPEQLPKFDPQRYYVDSRRGFSFELASKKNWAQPKLIRGIEAVFQAKSITFAEGLRGQIARNLALHPMGPMIQEVEMVRVASDESIEVEFTDETSNELVDTMMKRFRERAEEEGVELSKEDLLYMKRQLLGIEQMRFSNEFTISAFDKRKLKGVPAKPSLPNFFVALSSAMGLNVDHLVADEHSILGGVSVSLERVEIDEHVRDFRIDRWFLLAESQEALYLVEIAYSPQTTDSIQAWEELRAMMNSFHIFES